MDLAQNTRDCGTSGMYGELREFIRFILCNGLTTGKGTGFQNSCKCQRDYFRQRGGIMTLIKTLVSLHCTRENHHRCQALLVR